ncbi:hypothetical protein ACVRZD_04185 [Streptococcus hongkongensis]
MTKLTRVKLLSLATLLFFTALDTSFRAPVDAQERAKTTATSHQQTKQSS